LLWRRHLERYDSADSGSSGTEFARSLSSHLPIPSSRAEAAAAEGPRIFLDAWHFNSLWHPEPSCSESDIFASSMLSTRASFFVYIVSRPSRTIYIGVTNHLRRRVGEHEMKEIPGITATYHIDRLVWFEEFADPAAAIFTREATQGWATREKDKADRVDESSVERSELRVTRRSSRKNRGPSASLGMTD
jgi:putative endonuclease